MSSAPGVWVMTGAAGKVGSALRAGLRAEVDVLRLLDIVPIPAAELSGQATEEAVTADVTDLEALVEHVRGAQGILHLGGIPDEADFHDLVRVNVVGTYNVFEAARLTGVPRVVFASSNRLTGFYPAEQRVSVEEPVRPDGYYGWTKAAAESLGRLYADKFGLQVACVRIGTFLPEPIDARHLSTWLSPADAVRAFLAAMTAPDLRFAAFYAASANRDGWWDMAAGTSLGFVPRDDAAALLPDVLPLSGPEALQGGDFTSVDYSLSRQRPRGDRR